MATNSFTQLYPHRMSIGVVDDNYNWCDDYLKEDYDRRVHILAAFLVLIASSLGVLAPILQGHSRSRKISIFVDCGKHFGTGAILATAFIHMLPGAVQRLTSPCLPAVFRTRYTAFAGLFAMLAGLSMHLVEYLTMEYNDKVAETERKSVPEEILARNHYQTMPSDHTTPLLRNHNHNHNHNHNPNHHHHHHHHHQHGLAFRKNEKLSTYILEFGIASHSIIIGTTLGAANDSNFTGLLIALLLHQFFEGFALGARISDLDIPGLKKFYMSLAFIMTTPFGVLMGIILATSYNPNSQIALVTQGTLDSISAGILIYTAYANLIATEITNNIQFRKLPGRRKIYFFLSMYMGVAVMSLLGRWV